MAWRDKRVEFQQRFDTLSSQNIDALIGELNTVTGRYISSAGLTQNQDATTNPDYVKIVELANKAEDLKQKYNTLNDDILRYLKEQSKYNDMSTLLQESGDLQRKLTNLHHFKKEMKTDVESAVARDELLRTRDTKLNEHQLFILDRPVRRNMIPFYGFYLLYLWVLDWYGYE